MSPLLTLTRAQARVFVREPLSLLFGLVFPALLLVVIGTAFPGATDPTPEFGGRSLVDVYAPAAIILGLSTLAIAMLPANLGTDRERGILRRLSTTPAHPRALVAAHLAVQAVAVSCATAAAVLVGVVALDLPFPRSVGWFLLAFALATMSLLAVGLLIGALVPTASAGQTVGMLLYFPLLFFAGIYVPLDVMPEGVRTISGWTPAGAAVEALGDSWAGVVPAASSLLVMALYTLVAGGLAVWRFRWE